MAVKYRIVWSKRFLYEWGHDLSGRRSVKFVFSSKAHDRWWVESSGLNFCVTCVLLQYGSPQHDELECIINIPYLQEEHVLILAQKEKDFGYVARS